MDCECGHAKSDHYDDRGVCRHGWRIEDNYPVGWRVVKGCHCTMFEAFRQRGHSSKRRDAVKKLSVN